MDGAVIVDDLLDLPYPAFGTDEQIAGHLVRIRGETGASCIGVFPPSHGRVRAGPEPPGQIVAGRLIPNSADPP